MQEARYWRIPSSASGALEPLSQGRQPMTDMVKIQYLIRNYINGIDVGFVAHPSFVSEAEFVSISGPLSIAAAETDTIFPVENRHKSEEILRKIGVPFQINLFSKTEHGFAVRGDPKVKSQKFAKERAFQQAVDWFNEYI